MNTLIEQTLNGIGDSDQHILTLFGIAVSCKGKTYIELGVRNGTTTVPIRTAATLNAGKLYSVDISPNPFATPNTTNWEFIQSDAIEFLKKWEIDNMPTPDFIYIDDWHSYDHVRKELEILDRIVSPTTVILLHDLMYGNTCPFYHTDLTLPTGQWAEGGPYRAVAELNPQFWEFATLPWNNGLTILRKKYSNKFKQK